MRALLLAAALAFVAPALAAAAPPQAQMLPSGAMALGNPKAKVVVEEFASASCTHCAHFANTVFPAFRKKWVDTGKVRYVLMEYLTPPENVAAAAFLVARCAGPAGYFTVIEDFFARQDEVYRSGDLRAGLIASGAKAGLSADRVTQCMADGDALGPLLTRVQAGEARGVNSTPTFFVNGSEMQITSLADLDAAITKALK